MLAVAGSLECDSNVGRARLISEFFLWRRVGAKTQARKAAVSVNATHRETPTKTQTLTPCLRMIFTVFFAPCQKTFFLREGLKVVFSLPRSSRG